MSALKIKSVLLLLLLLSAYRVSAQDVETINTDRPDQSDGVYVLPKGFLQVENGILFEKGTVLNNLMLRYGLTGSTEFRALLDFGRFEAENGILPLGLSIKQRIIRGNRIVPSISIVGYVRLEPIASRSFRGDNAPIEAVLAFENELSDRFSIAYNLGLSTRWNDLNFTLTTLISYSVSPKISCFAEYFSHFENRAFPNHNLDAGFAYLINDRMQLDIAAGCNIFDREYNPFLTTGISYRF